MRPIRHWTPRYIWNRLAETYYRKTHPDHPWLTCAANQILASYLKESDIGLEFGGGRSTLWFARRTKHLTSVEHDEAWYNKVKQMLEDADQHNVDYHLIPMDPHEDNGSHAGLERFETDINVDYHLIPMDPHGDNGSDLGYVKILERFETDIFDYVLVDGVYRDFCALKALRVIRPGGMMIIDNANWYLPCDSYSPKSRTSLQGPKGITWEKVYQSLSQWRRIWTSSGVSDTAFFFKPFD